MNALPSRSGANYIRGEPSARAKEWFHFIVAADNADLLINFSISEGQNRLTLLFRDHTGWSGEVIGLTETAFAAGDTSLDAQEAGFSISKTELNVRATTTRFRLQLVFQIKSQFAFATNSVNAGSGSLNWIGIPRCVVTGEITADSRHFEFYEAPGYHDHNWGVFNWGQDFNWTWATFLAGPDDQYTGVYTSLRDQSGVNVLSEALMLWSGEDYIKTFRDRDIQVRHLYEGQQNQVLRIPGVMRLAIPGRHADIKTIIVTALTPDDSVTLTFKVNSVAQIGVPGTRPGATLLNEYAATAHLSGTVGNTEICQTSRAIVEEALTVSAP